MILGIGTEASFAPKLMKTTFNCQIPKMSLGLFILIVANVLIYGITRWEFLTNIYKESALNFEELRRDVKKC